jgi:hypothetical protein
VRFYDDIITIDAQSFGAYGKTGSSKQKRFNSEC